MQLTDTFRGLRRRRGTGVSGLCNEYLRALVGTFDDAEADRVMPAYDAFATAAVTEIGLPLDSGLSAFPSRARSTTLLARHAQWVVESRGPMHRIDRMRSRGSALWASLAWATRILSGDRVPSRASPVFFNTFLPVRRRTSSAAGATTERQCSLQQAVSR